MSEYNSTSVGINKVFNGTSLTVFLPNSTVLLRDIDCATTGSVALITWLVLIKRQRYGDPSLDIWVGHCYVALCGKCNAISGSRHGRKKKSTNKPKRSFAGLPKRIWWAWIFFSSAVFFVCFFRLLVSRNRIVCFFLFSLRSRSSRPVRWETNPPSPPSSRRTARRNGNAANF